MTAPSRQNAKGMGGDVPTRCIAFKTVQAQLWRIRHAVWQINRMPVSGTGPVCVNLLIFSDSGGIYPWQSKTRFTPDFPQNCNAIFQIISEKLIFVISLCQDRGQTMANTADSAKFVTNRAPVPNTDSTASCALHLATKRPTFRTAQHLPRFSAVRHAARAGRFC